MKLTDFYYADKHLAGTRMPILLPSGKDSGEWLQVVGPDCDVAIRAGRAYTAAVAAVDDELRPLEAECKAKEDFTRWNNERGWRVLDLNKQLAVELVTAWSFDEPFSKEAFSTLLDQYRGLAEAVCAHHTKSREALSAK